MFVVANPYLTIIILHLLKSNALFPVFIVKRLYKNKPMLRLMFCFLDWFSSHLAGLNACLISEVSRMELPTLSVLPHFVVAPDHLEPDGVHLTPAAGALFLSCLNTSLRSDVESDVTLVDQPIVVDESSDDDDVSTVLDNDEDKLGAILKVVTSNSKRLSSIKPLKATIEKLTSSTSAFEAQVRLRRQRDNLVFARIKEESDAELNRSREDRVVISGLDRSSNASTSHLEKKEHYKKEVTALVLKACPELEPKPIVVDVSVSLHRDQSKPSVEARFDSVSGACAFRIAAAALAKAKNPDFSALFFSNSITHATRVRIEIMKSIAKKLTTTTEKAYVQGFISRPVMRYVARNPEENFAAGTGRSYSFVDCVTRYGDLVHAHELGSAYRRAGATFRGAMEQYFVLLSENDFIGGGGRFSGSNQVPVGLRSGPSGSRGRGNSRGGRGRKRFGESPPNSPFPKKHVA